MIHLKNISVVIKKPILSNFNLQVNKGEKVILYGKSGGGKSTILRLLLGFIQPRTGEIIVDGQVLNYKNIWDLRKKIAYVSQDTDIGDGTVAEFFDDIKSLKANNKMTGPESFLSKFGLNKKILKESVEDLSGGEKQRISIVTSLMLGRKIFLLDEITSALDKKMKKKIVDFFLESKFTVLAISHDDSWLKENVRKVRV